MTILWLDYETRSHADLTVVGAHNYAQDASTKALCMAYAFDDEDPQLWWAHEPFPARVAAHFAAKRQIRAHNEEFDRLITWFAVCPDYGVPEPPLEAWYCTAAQARSNCAPGSLEDVGRFAGASMKKDHRGKQLVRACCLPPFKDDPALLRELGEYALQDVRAMRAVSQSMRELSDEELRDYHVNARINLRGVRVDRALCEAAVRYAAQEQVEIEQTVREVTGGAITSVRSPKMRTWVMERVGPQALALMETYKDGEKKYSIDKNARASLLALAEENVEEVPPEVADVVQCADDLWASSVAKFARAHALADVEDGRVRGAFVFAGGSATGRASSYGLQMQNFPRRCAKDPELVRQSIVRGHEITPRYGRRVTDVLKSMLRPMIIPNENKSLIVYDWASIEARVNPWLSCKGEATLQIFREGRDIYKSTAARMFNIREEDVTSDQRQMGKIAVLACGFASGVGAFDAMAKVYGVRLPETEARRMVELWRKANPWAQPFWAALDKASRRAMRNKGHEFVAGRMTYLFDGQHLWYALPSGRVLCYPYAQFDAEGNITYAKSAWKPAADAKEWPRARLWSGILVENATQATAHDMLRAALWRLDEAGFEVVAHCHDEIVAEHDTETAAAAAAQIHAIMVDPPSWAPNFPLAAEGSVMLRYGK